MAPQLVQLSSPGSHSLVSLLLPNPSTASIRELISQALQQDGDLLQLCPKPFDGHEKDLERWAVQLALASKPNRSWREEELSKLEDGIVPLDQTVADALADAASSAHIESPSITAPPTKPPNPTRQFSDFVLTGHLHRPLLRLVYLPLKLNVTFIHVPGFPDDWRFTMWTGASMSSGEVIEAIVEELGVKKVVAQGTKTSRVEYVLQVSDPSRVASPTLPFATKLIPHLTSLGNSTPYEVTFTISPTWLARAGTLALAVKKEEALKPRVATRDPTEDSGWRPASLWGGLWSSGGGKEPLRSVEALNNERRNSKAEDGMKLDNGGGDVLVAEPESEEEAEPTIKAKGSIDSLQFGVLKAGTTNSQTSARARLSTLFTDWVASEASSQLSVSASGGGSGSGSGSERTRMVSSPVVISGPEGNLSRFVSADKRASVVLNDEGVGGGVEGEPELDLAAALEALMEELGMKPAQREAMRQLPADRQRFLVTQHRESSVPSSGPPLRTSKTGPDLSTDSGGAFSGLKRFSLWGAAPPVPTPPSDIISATYDSLPSDRASASSPTSSSTSSADDTPNSATALPTPTSWTNWWSAASNATGAGHADAVGHQAKDTPQFYVDQMKSTKISQRSLIKHLIALRVRLSTSKLAWSTEFLEAAKGLDALESLLGKITLKRVNKLDVQSDEDETVQIECVKCLRVLMNTEIGFEHVLSHAGLITFIAYSLFTSSNKLRSQVADVLAALCVLSLRDGHRVVLAALSDFRVAHEERFRFEYLVESIKLREMQFEEIEVAEDEDEGGLWEYRTAAMSLINAIVNSPDDLEERMTLREEFTRRGLNEALTGLRYVNPPDAFVTQLSVYNEERQEDQEELRERTVGRSRTDTGDVPLGELIKLAQEHEDLYPLLVDTVKRYITVFERQDLDDRLRDDLITVLDQFLNHMVHLENFDEGWRTFMRAYLSSVQHIVGQQAVMRGSRIAESASVPTSFLEELEGLRAKVEELSDERTVLREELNLHIAETNTLRSLPSDRGSVDSSRTSTISERRHSFKKGDKENFSGVIQRLVQKEKQVLELQAELAQLSKAQGGPSEDVAAKKERNERTKRWEALMDEIARNKLKITELETEVENGHREIKYLKRALESVYSRFQAGVSESINTPTEPTSQAEVLEANVMAERTLEALAKRDEEIVQLRTELAAAKVEAAARLRLPKAFARPAPPPPSSLPTSTLSLPASKSSDISGFPNGVSPPSIDSTTKPIENATVPAYPPAPPPPPAPPTVPRDLKVSGYPPAPPPPPPPPMAPHPPKAKALQSTSSPSAPSHPAPLALPPPPPPPPRPPLRGPLAPSPPKTTFKGTIPTLRSGKKLKPFFWTKLEEASLTPTVWGDQNSTIPLDLSDLEISFAIESATKPVLVKEVGVSQKKATTTLLSLSRAQNVAIVLSRFKIKHSQIRDAVLHLDDRKLSLDNLKSIKHCVPTTDELEALRSFEGDITGLASADQFFNEMAIFPRLGERLSCMILRRRLELDLEEVKPDLTILRCAAEELQSSLKLKQILKTVLAIGNTLNSSSFRGNARGFQLDTLLKLKETRSSNALGSTPTLLHYLVRVLRRADESLLSFLDDAPHVEAASRVSVGTVLASVHTLVSGVAAVEEEMGVLKRMRKSPHGDRFLPTMESFARQAVPAIDALKVLSIKLDSDLRALVLYYGEDPTKTKAEDVFGIVANFSSALQRAQTEVEEADLKAKPPPAEKKLNRQRPADGSAISIVLAESTSASPVSGRSSIGRGGFDHTIRDIRSGTRRQRSTAQGTDRRLSRVFYDGGTR